jgi:hypothetical protein
LTNSANLAPGTLLLFRSGGAWYERVIVWATHGPFVHCAIMLGGQRIIEATRAGIQINHLRARELLRDAMVDLAQYASFERIDEALAWVLGQSGHKYGWLDIVFQAVKFLWPNNPFQLVQRDRWDCSDFVTRFCQQAGVLFPDDFDDPYANTPNDLGRVFGLLPPRKGHASALVRPRITQQLPNTSSDKRTNEDGRTTTEDDYTG